MFSKIEMFLCFCVSLVCSCAFGIGAGESSLPVPQSHTCVVGAGYSGLAAARYLEHYGLNFTVYEAAKDIGGNWRFDPRIGTDEYGVPIYTSQYKNLRVNTPFQTMEYNGFPFPENTISFPSGSCFFKYLKSFAREFDLMKYIKLHSFVTSVKLKDGYWNLIYTDAKSKTNYSVQCDFIIIANGQYVKPFVPVFDGQDDFEGYEFIQLFIQKNAELWTDTSALHLHQNIVNIRHPTMAFIGVVKRVVTRVLDAQAQYIASLVAGKFQLPSKYQMMLTSNCTLDVDTRKVCVTDMNKYFATLSKEAGIDRVPPVLIKLQEFIIDIRLKDSNYRDYDYKIIDDFNFKKIYNPRNETCDIAL